MLESIRFPSGPSMYGINYQPICVHATSVNVLKNRILLDKYLVKAGYT